ncbi:MAG: electron transport complex subunit RsxG [Buchnera aphidicola (Schlechtendalia peitan)]
MVFIKKNNAVIITLFFVSIITSSSVVLVHILTKFKIITQQENYQKIMLSSIVSKEFLKNAKISCFFIKNSLLGNSDDHKFWIIKKNSIIQALIFNTVAPDGYSGNINMIISLDLHGKILGVRVLDHHETPGLGDKIDIRISDWITKFSGIVVEGLKDSKFSLKKYGGNIDQFTGATITPLSVINAIKRVVVLTKQLKFKNLNLRSCDFYYE